MVHYRPPYFGKLTTNKILHTITKEEKGGLRKKYGKVINYY